MNKMWHINTMKYQAAIRGEQVPYIWDNMDETQRNYVEQMKPNTKECILYDYVNMKFKNRRNYSMVIENNCSGCGKEKREVRD